MSETNVGLIGLGNIGRIHYEVLEKFPQIGFSIVAIADQNLSDESRELLDSEVTIYSDYKKLLDDPEISVVSVNTPPNTHYQLVIDALNAGKHVLVEKPPVLTVEDCQSMIDLANRKGRVLFMSFHARYNPAVEEAKRELSGKNINGININYGEYALNYHHPDGWIFNPDIAGGGVLMDSGINALSIVTYILPEIELQSVNASFEQPEDFKVETGAEVDFTFGKNNHGYISMDWMQKGSEIRQVTFSTNNGDEYIVDIVTNHLIKNGVVVSSSGDGSNEMVDQYSEYRRVYEDFAKHLKLGTSLTSIKELAFILDTYKKATKA